MTRTEALKAWCEGNNAGLGYGPDADTIDEVVADLVNNYEGEILFERRNSEEIAVVRCGDGDLVGIGGDAMGRNPWCIKLPESQS